MKEYKIIAARADFEKQPAEKGSLMGSFRTLFDPHPGGSGIITEKIEGMLQQMNLDGWEVVSISPMSDFFANGQMLITLERELD